MSIAKVRMIIDQHAKSGEKNGKTWTMANVELDNGKTINIFNPIEVGDVVESYKNGDYWNWRKAKENAYDSTGASKETASASNDKVMEGLNAIYKMQQQLWDFIVDAKLPEEPKKVEQSTKVVESITEDLPPASAYDDLPFGEEN